ncbi:hypothetical protein H257_10481 [Aphanomyces astaci]|uniref:Uncharacterized protein n=1 Tax=Aphanomyces astaci TaxID=112090 RepID=W4G8L8_APHAT|nr:hypothetical protein H257_10481 [Aphanomyces astaci]ETV75298.1 hypothetical protein H257_10481 [Aphanomyces astaci]|eukprot:XP_009835346.1 hypothetical protein H257_10481 [Aphanomyces astaci]
MNMESSFQQQAALVQRVYAIRLEAERERMENEARQEVLNSGLVEDTVRGRTTDLDGQLAVTRVAHKELEALVLERSGMEKLRVERADLLDQTKALGDEISRIRSSEEVAVSAALSRMERQRQLDAAMVSALRAELGLSRARAEDDKALEQSRYDSELVQTRAAFEAEKREMLLESERNDDKWRTEFVRFKNEVLDASLAIREQARLDGDELRASLAQKDRTITLLERADAEKQTAALEIEEERRLNAVVDARDLQIRILEGEAHESNVNLNMLTDMNGELQSDLLSRGELRSERNVLEGTAAELVSAQVALAQERVRLDEAKRSFAAKVADERALFDEERRSRNDRDFCQNGWNCFACRQQPRTNPTSSLPWGMIRRIPFNNLTTCMTRRYKYGEPRLVVLRFLLRSWALTSRSTGLRSLVCTPRKVQ